MGPLLVWLANKGVGVAESLRRRIGARSIVSRHNQIGIAATLAALLLSAPGAWAACTQSGTAVTCSGATVNQNNPSGFGDFSQNGLIINVVSGASVTGTSDGMALGSTNTVNNDGLIQGGGGANGTVSGIVTTGDLTVMNTGNITALTTSAGASALGVNVSGTAVAAYARTGTCL